MKHNFFIRPLYINIFLCALTIATILGIIKSIFVGIDMDESYAIVQSYRILLGDKSFYNMWEPHQMSAYLATFFMQVFTSLTGSTDYLVIFLRIVGTCTHLIVAILVCYSIKDLITSKINFIIFLLQVNFLSKWIQSPEFELMHYWLLMLTFVCLYNYYKNHSFTYLLPLSGFCIMLQILNYPTMLFLYPLYVWVIYMQHQHSLKEILFMTSGSLVGGLLYSIYIFKDLSFHDFKTALTFITSDPSHTERSLLENISIHLQSIGLDIVYILSFVIVLTCILKFCYKKQLLSKLVLYAFYITGILYTITCFTGYFLLDQNQFFLQSRYAVIVLLGLYFCHKSKEYHNPIALFGILPGILSFILSLLVTNMDVNTQYSKLFPCSIFVFILIASRIHSAVIVERAFFYTLTIATLIPLLFCRLTLIRVSGCLPVTILAPLTQVTNGALKGVYTLDKIATNYNNLSILSNYIGPEDSVFYFGHDPLIYLYQPGAIATFSVQGTTVFNEDALTYFEYFPEKYPTIIVIDKTYPSDYYFTYSPYNYIVVDWIDSLFSSTIYEDSNIKLLQVF